MKKNKLLNIMAKIEAEDVINNGDWTECNQKGKT